MDDNYYDLSDVYDYDDYENDRQDNPNSYYMFPTIPSAEEFINRNNDREMFFYITEQNQVIVSPWNDATETETSPRFLERFDQNTKEVLYGGEHYDVKYFGHTHPDGSYSDPSDADREVAIFFNYYEVNTLIYFENYFFIYFDEGEQECINPFF